MPAGGLSDDSWNGDFGDCFDHILKPAGITTDELRQHPEGIQVPIASRQERQFDQTGFQTPSGKVEIAYVEVSSLWGSIRLKAHVTDVVPPGVVHAMHNWQRDANVNILADDRALDPISGFASFKAQLCQVSKE